VPVQEQVEFSIASRRLFSPNQSILVAVSGGVDSMVLLKVLAGLSAEHGWKLTVAHLNHQLRGASSAADERLVRRVARDLDLPIVVSRADVRRFAQSTSLSIEMAARKLRHDFLAAAASERRIPSVALAHHLDDQIELFFLRLFRGSGSQGLVGMKWLNPSPSNPAVTLVRPLLDCSKASLLEYAASHRIRFRHDSSNDCLDIQRNRIRHELLPLLRQDYQPALTRTISRLASIVGAESELANAFAESWLAANLPQWNASNRNGAPGKDRKQSRNASPLWLKHAIHCSFEALPTAVQRSCLQLQLLRKGIVPAYELIEHLRLHPDKPIEVASKSAKTALSLDVEGGQPFLAAPLRIARLPEGALTQSFCPPSQFLDGFCQVELDSGPGKTAWDGLKFSWEIRAARGVQKPRKRTGIEFFDADTVGSALILRHWRPGDRFQPIGMDRPVKLQDLFINQKVPRAHRGRLAVASTARGELFWVEGLRISDRFKLTKSTIRRLHWAWQRL
jgi:tRNA(Ile)-lysidine synthase